MRLILRLVLGATFAIGAPALAVASCGTSAVGTQACQDIEFARCEVAPGCSPGFDVAACQRFYRDECLVGIENTSPDAGGGDLTAAGQACATAITQVAGCASGATSPLNCSMLIPDASCYEVDAAATACNIVLNCPEVTPACNFIGSIAPVDAGTDADASDDGDAATDDDAGDASDATSE